MARLRADFPGAVFVCIYEKTNVELSQARAESARQALTEGGMAPDKIEAKGRADSRPIASNTTAEGRQKNRRVEIVVGH